MPLQTGVVSSCASLAGMEVLPRNVHRNRIADGPQPFGVFTNAKNAV
jgi:hypothetical protein